jgi:hypothetical protein
LNAVQPRENLRLALRAPDGARARTLRKKEHSVITRRNRLKTLALTLPAIVAAIALIPSRLSTQNVPFIIGRIEGGDISVKTTTQAGLEIFGGPTVVASGSDVTVRSGQALLSLDSGGEISICGPAHFTLVDSAGAITMALDYGRVHPSLDSSSTFTIYTPSIVATPVAISGARRDTTLGLNQEGEMCILTSRGAMRVEPQFGGQSVIVPQGGVANLMDGQIESLQREAASCSCDFQRASVARPHPAEASHPPLPREIGTLSRPLQPNRRKLDSALPPALAREPVYTVIMPALSFDASSPAPPPDPSPETILLVREIRMRPSAIFRGHVNPAPITPPPTAPIAMLPSRPLDDRRAAPKPGLMARLRIFFQRLNNQVPCAGTGCGH